MKKVHCDKCGFATNEFSFENTGTATITINGPSFAGEADQFHLCLECTQVLKNWLKDEVQSMSDINTDDKSIDLLLNSLNAGTGACRPTLPTLANLLLTAQGTIAKLRREVKELRKEKEDQE